MKVYTFIFTVGFLNLIVPFMGIPFVYKNYTLLTLAAVTLGYALIIRTIEKEKENSILEKKSETLQERKIEDVVEMIEEKESVIVSDVIVRQRAGRPRIIKEKIKI